MKKFILLVLVTTSSGTVFADKYSWNWIPIPSNNLNIGSGNQQITNGLNQMVNAISNINKNESNNVSYTTNGSFTNGSDGSSYYNTEDRSYGSNGNTYYQMNENNGYDSNRAVYNRVGDYIYITQPSGQKYVCYESSVGLDCKDQ